MSHGIQADEVLYCPGGRDPDYGIDSKRGLKPENVIPVFIGESRTSVDERNTIIARYEESLNKNKSDNKNGVRFVLKKGHENWPLGIKAAIIKGMQTACDYYNRYADFDRLLLVSFVPSVPTADASWSGEIRFGQAIENVEHFIPTRVALHEIAHTIGVGIHGNWRHNIDGEGVWQGTNARAVFEKWKIEKPSVVRKKFMNLPKDFGSFGEIYEQFDEIHADAAHFWPGGLNYDSEYNTDEDIIFHIEMVLALRKDCDEMGNSYWMKTRLERERTMKKRGMYFCLWDPETNEQAIETICWSKSTTKAKMRCDEAWLKDDPESIALYMQHRKDHLMPQDFTHVELLNAEETAIVDKNDEDFEENVDTLDIEDENEEFVVSYYNSCDQIFIANADEGGRLNIVEATYGSSCAKAISVTEKVQDLVQNSTSSDGVSKIGEFLTFGADRSIYQTIGDPEPGVEKVFKCIFSDGIPGSPGSYIVQYRDKKTLDLNWVHQGSNTIVFDLGHRGRDLWIQQATWGTSEEWGNNLDVTDRVRGLVFNGRLWSQTLNIGALLPSDPAVDQNKIFTVKFTSL